MTGNSRPRVETASISEFLSGDNTYLVPTYQRNYAWQDEHVNQLIEDLESFSLAGEDPYYLLGQVILAPNLVNTADNCKYAVVDGQQRLTTIYLLLVALQEQFRSFGVSDTEVSPAGDCYRQINLSIWFQRPSGQRQNRFKATKYAAQAIDKILAEEQLAPVQGTESADRVRENYQTLTSWIKNSLTEQDRLVDFASKLLNDVFLIRADLDSEEQALDIFEKINNRGKALNSAELFKNLLFSKVSSDEYGQLDGYWDKAGLEIYKLDFHRAASMEYLMQALLAQRKGTHVSTKNVYKEWGLIWKEEPLQVLTFAQNLVDSAKKLALVGSKAVPETDFNRQLVTPKYFEVVQHLPAALATTKFKENTETYQSIIRFIDARIALFLIAEEKANTANADMWRFSKAIASLPEDATFQLFLNSIEFGRQEASNLLDAAAPRIRSLRYSNTRDRKRMRYILALISHWVEDQTGDAIHSNTLNSLLITRGKEKFDLDHITPQSHREAPDFDLSNGSEWVDSIGNLTLLFSKDNRSAQAANPRNKSRDYASSKLLLTRSLATREDLTGLNQRVTNVLQSLSRMGSQSVENWEFEASKAQSEFYVRCFSEAILERLGFN
jgi:hypothetical protein